MVAHILKSLQIFLSGDDENMYSLGIDHTQIIKAKKIARIITVTHGRGICESRLVIMFYLFCFMLITLFIFLLPFRKPAPVIFLPAQALLRDLQ